jgi:predicted ATPase
LPIWALVNGLATVKTPAYLHILRPPTIELLRNEILSGYDILHFDGHGAFALRCPSCLSLFAEGSRKCGNCDASLEAEKPRGYLAFEQEDGKQDALAADELAEMLQTVPGSPTKLVFLSACESAKGEDQGLAATLLQGGIPAVLGMKESVLVETTVALSRALYAALGAGMTIEGAFKNSLPALSRLPDSRETGTKARDIPTLQGPGVGKRMIVAPVRGSLILEKERLFGVPEFDFVGEYIPGHPPRGRKGLLSQATDALLRGEKLVVLTGQGGIGKSVLAAVAARRISWRYPGGVFWRSAANAELGLNELLDAFAVPGVFSYEFRTQSLDAKRDTILGYLGDLQTPCLLVVDNAENVKDPALWQFLEGLPQPSAALVTTREALKREGTQISIVQMEPLEAFRLFESEARRRSPSWGEQLNQAETEAMEEIIHCLDGHPLGIKLAAGLLASGSLEAIRQKLRESPPGEEIFNRFDFSYDTLELSQRELLHRLAAFAGSYAEWAAEAVSGLELFEEDAAELLEQWREDHSELVRKSFVDMLDMRGSYKNENEVPIKRYRLHPLMRQYAAAKAGDDMEAHRSRAAHLFLGFAESNQSCDALEQEHDNVLAAANWAYSAGEWELAKRYAWAADSYLSTRGYWKDRKRLLNQAFEATHELGDKSGVSSSLHNLGRLAQDTGDYDEARRLYQESLKIKQELGDKSGVAFTIAQLALLEEMQGDIKTAVKLTRQAEAIFKELGAPHYAEKARMQRERMERKA